MSDDDIAAPGGASGDGRRGGDVSRTNEAPIDELSVKFLGTGRVPEVSSPFSSQLCCINDRAVWNLSGAKPGNGVDELLDGDTSTFWQSDGAQPHLLTLRFYSRQTVLGMALYLDYSQDESYTPKTIGFRAGHILHNLRVIRDITLREPRGWIWVPFWDPEIESERPRPLRVHLIQMAVTSMHQSGRDTHVRQIMVFGPQASTSGAAAGGGTTSAAVRDLGVLATVAGEDTAGIGGLEFSEKALTTFASIR